MQPTFILFHGAWLGGWCFEKVRQLACMQKIRSIAPDLSLSEATQDKFLDGELLVQKALTFVEADPTPKILVGHSVLGGWLISQMAERNNTHIQGLIYVCAYLPTYGESYVDLVTGNKKSLLAQPGALRYVSEDVYDLALDTIQIQQAFYGCCSEEVFRQALARRSRRSFVPLNSRLHRKTGYFQAMPKYYVVCTKDAAIVPSVQQKMIERGNLTGIFHLETDHSPFLSCPEQLGNIFAHIATQDDNQSATTTCFESLITAKY